MPSLLHVGKHMQLGTCTMPWQLRCTCLTRHWRGKRHDAVSCGGACTAHTLTSLVLYA